MNVTVIKNQPIRLKTRGDYCDNCEGKILQTAYDLGVMLPAGNLTPLRKDLVQVSISFQPGRFILCPACVEEMRK